MGQSAPRPQGALLPPSESVTWPRRLPVGSSHGARALRCRRPGRCPRCLTALGPETAAPLSLPPYSACPKMAGPHDRRPIPADPLDLSERGRPTDPLRPHGPLPEAVRRRPAATLATDDMAPAPASPPPLSDIQSVLSVKCGSSGSASRGRYTRVLEGDGRTPHAMRARAIAIEGARSRRAGAVPC